MRLARSIPSLSISLALGLLGCGGSQPPPVAPEAAAPAAPASATDAPATKPATEEDGWAGENAAKNGDTKAPETRTMDVIRKLVMDNRKAARKCYEDARKDLKDLKGDVTIHFVLDPEGSVKTAELNQERSTLKSPAVVNCVIGVIKGIKFPKSSRAMETSTNYPFNFTP